MKPSKSVGDIMSEINKSEMQQPERSARNTAAEPEQRNLERAKKRLSSFTPPPSGSVPGQRSSADRGVSEWIPWPDLDGPPKPQSSQLDVDFENLSEDSVKKCKKLADMGFDLRRVVKVTLDKNRYMYSKVSSHLRTDWPLQLTSALSFYAFAGLQRSWRWWAANDQLLLAGW